VRGVGEPETPVARPPGPRSSAVARLAVLALAAGLLARGLTTPFFGWHELNSAMYAQFARNHIEYGLGYTALYCTWGDTASPPEVPDRYLNHPPLIALWTAVPLLLLGDHEWTARLVPIAATLGSVALLMTIVGRVGGALLGVLAGYFFATLPLTAYFGRMIDHVAPVQLFTLLMLHGYLEWTGVYPGPGRPRRGAFAWLAGVVLGIGTGWAAVLGAGLLLAWHARRVARGKGDRRALRWLALAPLLSLGAVVLHILAGCGWDLGMLRALAADRSLGGLGGAQPWPAWLAAQGVHFIRNFTWPGAVAAAVVALVLGARLARPRRDAERSGLPLGGDLAAVVGLTGLHGLAYVALFKNAAWFHDYWQFFLGPFVACSLAALALPVARAAASRVPRLAPVVVVALLALPWPGLVDSLAFYSAHRQPHADYASALIRLAEVVPRRAPVWTSRPWELTTETISRHASRRPSPLVAYYANRPLLHSRDIGEIEANRPGCAAYLLTLNDRDWSRELDAALSRSHERVPAGPRHAIFLLSR
jgi:hypothetical protein